MSARNQRLFALLVLVLVHLAVSFVVPRWAYRVHPIITACLLGAFISQAPLLAVWATLAEAMPRLRWPGALAAAVASYFLWELSGTLLPPLGGREAFRNMYMLPMQLTVLFYLLPLTMARWGLGWRIRGEEPAQGGRGFSNQQFGLRDLLIWTTGIALLLALGQWLLDPFRADSLFVHVAAQIGQVGSSKAIILISTMPSLCLLGACMGRRRGLWIAATLVAAVVAIVGSYLLFLLVVGNSLSILAFVLVQLCFLAAFGGTLAVLHASGWRFVLIAPWPPRKEAATQPSAAQENAESPHAEAKVENSRPA